MNMKQVLFGMTVQAVCKHPKRYTFNGTFGEVIAMLEYYALGAHIFNHSGHHGMHPFHTWLSTKPEYKATIKFVGWGEFRDIYPDDETAIKELARLYKEFEKTLLNEESTIDLRLSESESITLVNLLSKVIEIDDGSSIENSEKEIILNFKNLLENKIEGLEMQRDFWFISDSGEITLKTNV